MKTALLDLLYPRECGACGVRIGEPERLAFCAACDGRFEWIAPPACPRCGAASSRGACGECAGRDFLFAGATALGAYEGRLRDFVLRQLPDHFTNALDDESLFGPIQFAFMAILFRHAQRRNDDLIVQFDGSPVLQKGVHNALCFLLIQRQQPLIVRPLDGHLVDQILQGGDQIQRGIALGVTSQIRRSPAAETAFAIGASFFSSAATSASVVPGAAAFKYAATALTSGA